MSHLIRFRANTHPVIPTCRNASPEIHLLTDCLQGRLSWQRWNISNQNERCDGAPTFCNTNFDIRRVHYLAHSSISKLKTSYLKIWVHLRGTQFLQVRSMIIGPLESGQIGRGTRVRYDNTVALHTNKLPSDI